MRAVTYTKYGAARDVLEMGDHSPRDPYPGEVRVALAFSGVNPSDVKRRASARPGTQEPPFERVCPHSDGSGVIEAVGAGVDAARVGQRVWIWNGHWHRNWGTAAEKITLAAAQAVPLPAAISLETGACLGIPGLTAAHCVLGGGDIAGKTVLIHGGAGSVGFLAVQLAKWAGARVIATASSKDFNKCAQGGADAVVDYRSDDLSGALRDAAGGTAFHRIVDVEFGRNIAVNAEVIAANGVLSVFGSQKDMQPSLPFHTLLFKAVTIDIALIYILPWPERARAIEALHAALNDGALTCPLDHIYPLFDTAQAHERVENGGRAGATLVDVRL